jgi:hypothetical protein
MMPRKYTEPDVQIDEQVPEYGSVRTYVTTTTDLYNIEIAIKLEADSGPDGRKATRSKDLCVTDDI